VNKALCLSASYEHSVPP